MIKSDDLAFTEIDLIHLTLFLELEDVSCERTNSADGKMSLAERKQTGKNDVHSN